jgi:SAM-dependent methyltransferase
MNRARPRKSIHPASFSLHPSSEAYGSFAYAYDQALGERFFRSVRRLLTRVLGRFPSRDRTHLDVACGTGLAMDFFKKRRYRSVGIDLSMPMLQVARKRATDLIAADMRALPLRTKFSCVTCLYDSLNHLKSVRELAAAFRAVQEVLSHDGLFLFDVNHPDAYPDVWGNPDPFVAHAAGFHLKMATKFRRRDRLAHAIVTGWAMVDGKKVRIHERREQRAYTERQIIDALASAGLAPVEVIEFDPYSEGRGVKLFFVCRHV